MGFKFVSSYSMCRFSHLAFEAAKMQVIAFRSRAIPCCAESCSALTVVTGLPWTRRLSQRSSLPGQAGGTKNGDVGYVYVYLCT